MRDARYPQYYGDMHGLSEVDPSKDCCAGWGAGLGLRLVQGVRC